MRFRSYTVYILGSQTNVLYVGVTNDLMRRMFEHKQGLVPGFTSKYNVKRLLYHEAYNGIATAIAREKEVKGWLRRKKWALIRSQNPELRDLAADWFDPMPSGRPPSFSSPPRPSPSTRTTPSR